jgi:hypothetical protein
MKRRLSNSLLAGLALLVIAAVAILVWRVQSSSAPPQTPSPPEPIATTGPVDRPNLPGATERRRRADRPAAATAEPGGAAAAKPVAEILREARSALRDTIRSCVDPADPAHLAAADQRITLRYTIRIDSERARIDRVQKVASSVTDRALEDCIFRRAGETRWAAPGVRQLDKRSQQSIRIEALLPAPAQRR